jgi:hypothetical protein
MNEEEIAVLKTGVKRQDMETIYSRRNLTSKYSCHSRIIVSLSRNVLAI